MMIAIEKGEGFSEDPLLSREQVYSPSSDFDTEPFRSSTSLDEEERIRRLSRSSVYAASYFSSFCCLVMVGVVITFVLFMLLLLQDPWQRTAILILLALSTSAVLMICAHRLRVRE